MKRTTAHFGITLYVGNTKDHPGSWLVLNAEVRTATDLGAFSNTIFYDMWFIVNPTTVGPTLSGAQIGIYRHSVYSTVFQSRGNEDTTKLDL